MRLWRQALCAVFNRGLQHKLLRLPPIHAYKTEDADFHIRVYLRIICTICGVEAILTDKRAKSQIFRFPLLSGYAIN